MKISINGISLKIRDIIENQVNKNKLTAYQKMVVDKVEWWFSTSDQIKISTSGSTGIPKEIKLTRNQILSSIKHTIEYFNLQPEEKAFLPININFIGGLMMIFRCLESNMELDIIEPTSNPAVFLSDNVYKITSMVPLQLETAFNEGYQKKLNQVDNIILGGGPVSKKLENIISNLDCDVFHSYGMTETASHIALRPLTKPLSDWFEVFPAIEIKQSTDGCLEIKGGVTNNQWLKSNDVVYIENNKFKWLGRKDFIINSGGIKINPEMIEALLYDYLGSQIASNFIVGGIKDEQLGEKVAIIATKGSSNVFDLRNINQYLIDSGLDKYKLPKALLFLDYFDFTGSGKLDRKKILTRVNES